MKIIKSAGPDKEGTLRGHCYNGAGWEECPYWDRENDHKCTLFNVEKEASKSLNICDKVYGTSHEGDV